MEQMCCFIERESAQILGKTNASLHPACNENGEASGFHLLLRYNKNKVFEVHCDALSDALYKWEQLKEMLQFATNDTKCNE